MPSQKPARSGLLDPITFLLIATLAITPWFFGGVWARVQSVLMFASVLMLALCVLQSARSAPARSYLPAAFLPLVLAILLGLFQLIPLGPGISQKLAAGSTKWRAEAAPSEAIRTSTSPNGVAARSSPVTSRSLYPPATREHLALLVLVTCVFWVAAQNLSQERSLSRFLLAVTICGAAVALFGLIQRFTWNGQIYWSIPLTQGGNPFGPYVNRNNAGGFLNLCLAAALGLLVWTNWRGVATGYADGDVEEAKGTSRHAFGKREEGIVDDLREWFVDLNARRLLLMASLVLLAGAIVASASRGSILSLAFAGAVLFAISLTQRGKRLPALGIAVCAAAAIALVTWLGQDVEVRARFGNLIANDTENMRLLNWADAVQALPDFYGFGSGLNTYRFVCPPFEQRFTSDRWHYYAENQYLQALIDGGIVALVLLLSTIALVMAALVHLFRRGGRTNTAIATMGTFALASQIVGASFDFGLYLPANAMLMAAICGTVVGRAVMINGEGGQRWYLGSTVRQDTAAIVSLPLIIGAFFGGVELHRAAAVEAVVAPAVQGRIETENPPAQIEAADEALRNWIDRAVAATEHRADDANAHRTLADLWIQRYRIATYRSLRQQQPWLAEEDTWQASSLFNLHNTMRDMQPAERAEFSQQIRDDPGANALLTPAWQHAVRARDMCPWLPQTYLTLASLAPFVGDEPDSSVHLAQARKFAGGDPRLWYQIGLLEMAAGRTADALASWRQSLQLSPQYEALVLAEILDTVDVDRIVDEVLPKEPGARLRCVNRLRKTRPGDARRVAERALKDMEAHFVDEDGSVDAIAARHNIRAMLLATVERHEEAITEWEQALKLMPERIPWRIELAESLLEAGKPNDAYEQIARCLREQPDSTRLKAMLERSKADMVDQT